MPSTLRIITSWMLSRKIQRDRMKKWTVEDQKNLETAERKTKEIWEIFCGLIESRDLRDYCLEDLEELLNMYDWEDHSSVLQIKEWKIWQYRVLFFLCLFFQSLFSSLVAVLTWWWKQQETETDHNHLHSNNLKTEANLQTSQEPALDACIQTRQPT